MTTDAQETRMSQHAIEEFIERCVQLVDRGSLSRTHKAALMRSLLGLQARYDTGLTWFRVAMSPLIAMVGISCCSSG
ncbi:hypothetical protein [Xanthomonas campestris]|uniref:hypothetical protein n=2 Tax=Xanthomonas campestris TaxID=339 RepID=UPI002AD216BD|nr:hypothetical protein [Xanthomonas campestris]